MTEQPVTAEFISDTAALTKTVENRVSQVEKFVWDNDIERLWGEFVAEAEHGAGTKQTHFHGCRARQWSVDYTISVTPDHVRFSGTDNDGDRHTYTIPAGFLFPETREQAKEAFRARLRGIAVAEREKDMRARQAALAAKQAEVARLEAQTSTRGSQA